MKLTIYAFIHCVPGKTCASDLHGRWICFIWYGTSNYQGRGFYYPWSWVSVMEVSNIMHYVIMWVQVHKRLLSAIRSYTSLATRSAQPLAILILSTHCECDVLKCLWHAYTQQQITVIIKIKNINATIPDTTSVKYWNSSSAFKTKKELYSWNMHIDTTKEKLCTP